MAEPFSLSAYLLQSVLVPIGAQLVAQHATERTAKRVVELRRWGSAPVNHDLERAARRAYLLAARVLNDACLEELGASAGPFRRRLRKLLRPEAEIDELDKLRATLTDELKRVRRDDTPLPRENEIEGRFDLLLNPRGRDAQESVEEAKSALKRRLVEEIAEWTIEPPPLFHQMLREGWEQPSPNGGQAGNLEWFALLCAFFVDDLKRNPELERALSVDVLADIPGLSAGVKQLEARWDEYAASAMPLLERIDAELERLFRAQRDQFTAVVGALEDQAGRDRSIATEIAGINDRIQELRELVLEGSQTALTGLDPAQIFARSREIAAYRNWEGARVAASVDQLLSEYRARAFVGRDDKLAALHRFLETHSSGRVAVTAPAGYGKTALLANWIVELEERGAFVAYHLFSQRDPTTASVKQAYQNLLRQLRIYYEDPEPSDPPDEERLVDDLRGLVMTYGAPNGRLVIAIDGLDEAASGVVNPFALEDLPEGVYVVVSARAERDECPGYLADWTQDSYEPVRLERLTGVAIADWLRSAGDGELAQRADDAGFVDEVAFKTEGFPLHLHHLLEEMVRASRAGRDVTKLLAETPAGFVAYVRDQLRALTDPKTVGGELWDLLALLAVAKGPLRYDEIGDLSSDHGRLIGDRELIGLRDRWRVARWLRFAETAEHEETLSFAQPLLARTFAGQMRGDARHAENRLTEWCSNWDRHDPRWEYALRHYPDHLFDSVPELHEGEEGWDEVPPARTLLYALARDERYRDAQVKRFPEEPDLALRSLHASIRAAAKTDDSPAMAEFFLRHARLLLEIRQSPLSALETAGLARAWQLADLATIEESVLWHLLLAWSLVHRGDARGASETLERLLRRQPGPLSGWREVAAGRVLAELLCANGRLEAGLFESTLGDVGRAAFARQVVVRASAWEGHGASEVLRGALAQAVAASTKVSSQSLRATLLAEVAEAQARLGEQATATQTLAMAEGVIAEIGVLATALQDAVYALCRGHVRAGDLTAARRWSDELRDATLRIQAHAIIAIEYLERGQEETGAAVFEEALEIARGSGAAAEFEVARVGFYGVGEVAGEEQPAVTAVSRVGFTRERMRAWTVSFLGSAGSEGLARMMAQLRVEDSMERALLLAEAGRAQGASGQADRSTGAAAAARAAGRLVEPPLERALTLIAVAEAEAGVARPSTETLADIRDSLTQIGDPGERAVALISLADMESDAGLPQEAERDLEEARRAADSVPDDEERVEKLLAVGRASTGAPRAAAFETARELSQILGPRKYAETLIVIANLEAAAAEPRGRGTKLHLGVEAALMLPAGAEKVGYLLAIAQLEANTDRPERAVESLSLAREATDAIRDPVERSTTLSFLADMQTRLGHPDLVDETTRAAQDAALDVEDDDLREGILSLLVFSHLQAGRFDRALATARLNSGEMRAFSLWAIALSQVERGLPAESEALFREAIAAARESTDPANQAAALVAIADRYSFDPGISPRPLEWLRDVAADPDLPADDALGKALEHAVEAVSVAGQGKPDLARERLKAACDAGWSIEPAGLRATFIQCVFHIAAGAHLWGLAPATFQRMLDELRATMPPEECAYALADIMHAAAHAGAAPDTERALRFALDTAGEIGDPSRRTRVLARVGTRLVGSDSAEAARGCLEEAVRAASDGVEIDLKVVGLMAVGRAQLRSELDLDADRSFAAAASAGREAESPKHRRMLLNAVAEAATLPLRGGAEEATLRSLRRRRIRLLLSIAGAQQRLGRLESAQTSFAAAKKAAEEIPDEALKADAISAVEELMAEPEQGDSEPRPPVPAHANAQEAMQQDDVNTTLEALAAPLTPPAMDVHSMASWALASIAGEQAAEGDWDAALETAGLIRIEQVRESAFADIEWRRQRERQQPTAHPSEPESALAGARQGIQPDPDDGSAVAGTERLREDERGAVSSGVTKEQILMVSGRRHLEEAADYARSKERDLFELKLVPCAYYPELAPEVCTLLARVYPAQSRMVARTVQSVFPDGTHAPA